MSSCLWIESNPQFVDFADAFTPKEFRHIAQRLPRFAATLGTRFKLHMYPERVPSLGVIVSQSLSSVIVHFVFFHKGPPPVPQRHWHSRTATCGTRRHVENIELPAIITGGVEDHIHLLARQSRTITLSDWVKE